MIGFCCLLLALCIPKLFSAIIARGLESLLMRSAHALAVASDVILTVASGLADRLSEELMGQPQDTATDSEPAGPPRMPASSSLNWFPLFWDCSRRGTI